MKKSILITLGLVVGAILAVGGTARGDEVGSFTVSNCRSGGSECPGATYTFNVTPAISGITIDELLSNLNRQLMGIDLGFTRSGMLVDPLALDFSQGQNSWSSITSILSGFCNNNKLAFLCTPGSGTFPVTGVTGPRTPGRMTPTPEPGTGTLAMLGLALMGMPFVLRRAHT
ncbi:MAG TPA: PEP-CTERM sorting domain-containing protein [Candidatus Acidoferrum sp.]|nr:PEP-CTERM sorting domain-containing protein [Candidatus Acidoferrum sp.]